MRVVLKIFDIDEEYHTAKIEFNQYFYTILLYIWIPTGLKEIAHLWWFRSSSIGKLLPCIVWKTFV